MDLHVPAVTVDKAVTFPLDPFLRFIDLVKSDEHWTPRLRLPENTAPERIDERAAGEKYWNGGVADWAALQAAVDAGKGVAVLVERSGLLVLDCDVRHRDDAGWIVREPGRASWDAGGTQYGEEDLYRIVAGMGRTLPKTWTVGTKSGGTHFYFRCAPKSVRSSGHRRGWAVDVKASANTWVVAPPTPGYSVIESYEIAVAPDWLVDWLNTDLMRLEPLGGAQRATRSHQVRTQYQEQVKTHAAGQVGEGIADIQQRWVSELLLRVAESNVYGGWNQEIFNAACLLREAGYTDEAITEIVVKTARPWDERERRTAERTVKSALGRVGGRR